MGKPQGKLVRSSLEARPGIARHYFNKGTPQCLPLTQGVYSCAPNLFRPPSLTHQEVREPREVNSRWLSFGPGVVA